VNKLEPKTEVASFMAHRVEVTRCRDCCLVTDVCCLCLDTTTTTTTATTTTITTTTETAASSSSTTYEDVAFIERVLEVTRCRDRCLVTELCSEAGYFDLDAVCSHVLAFMDGIRSSSGSSTTSDTEPTVGAHLLAVMVSFAINSCQSVPANDGVQSSIYCL